MASLFLDKASYHWNFNDNIIGISILYNGPQICLWCLGTWDHQLIQQTVDSVPSFDMKSFRALVQFWKIDKERMYPHRRWVIADIHVIVVAMLMIFWCDQCGVREFTGKSVGEHVRIVRDNHSLLQLVAQNFAGKSHLSLCLKQSLLQESHFCCWFFRKLQKLFFIWFGKPRQESLTKKGNLVIIGSQRELKLMKRKKYE